MPECLAWYRAASAERKKSLRLPLNSATPMDTVAFRGSRSDFFRSADAALYRAKHSGKDCVVAADPSEPD